MAVKKFLDKHFTLILFFFFTFLYITAGLWLSYNNTFIVTDNNTFFGSDTARVFRDLTEPVTNHYRISVHPLMLLLLQPLVSLIDSLFHDMSRTVVLLQSLIASANVCLIFSILKLLIFTSIPETYIFSAFSQLLLLYYALNIKNKGNLNYKNILTLAVLGMISTGIILANVISFLIIICWLLRSIYTNKPRLFIAGLNKAVLRRLLALLPQVNPRLRCLIRHSKGSLTFLIASLSRTVKIIFSFCVLLLLFTFIQEAAFFHALLLFTFIQEAAFFHAPSLLDFLCNLIKNPATHSEIKYLDFGFNLAKVNTTFIQMFTAPILAPDFYLIPDEKIIKTMPNFYVNCEFSWQNILAGVSLYLAPLVILFKKRPQNSGLLATIALIILINTVLLFFYGNQECFIYSQNYLCLIFIFAGIVVAQCRNSELFYKIFLQIELILNFIALRQIDITIYHFTLMNNFRTRWILQAFIIVCIIAVFINILKTVLSKTLLKTAPENKYACWLSLYFAFIFLSVVLTNLSKFRV